MKHSITYLLLFFVTILVSSCFQVSNLSVEKRHYRNGYYISYTKHPHAEEPAASANKSESPAEQASASVSSDPAVSAPTQESVQKDFYAEKEAAPAPYKKLARKKTYTASEESEKTTAAPSIEMKKPFSVVRHAPEVLEKVRRDNGGHFLLVLLIIILIVILLSYIFPFGLENIIWILWLVLLILLILWLIQML